MEKYLLEVQELSYEFIGLLAEAFGLPADTLKQFYDTAELMQHRGKIVQYPQTESESQGVGPHYDAGFLTFVRLPLPHIGEFVSPG
jgi:isopenicillin N synthase-like dioxygenase